MAWKCQPGSFRGALAVAEEGVKEIPLRVIRIKPTKRQIKECGK